LIRSFKHGASAKDAISKTHRWKIERHNYCGAIIQFKKYSMLFCEVNADASKNNSLNVLINNIDLAKGNLKKIIDVLQSIVNS
jgi:hypothetical protein